MFPVTNFLFLISLAVLSWVILVYLNSIEKQFQSDLQIEEYLADVPPAESVISRIEKYDFYINFFCIFACTYGISRIWKIINDFVAKQVQTKIFGLTETISMDSLMERIHWNMADDLERRRLERILLSLKDENSALQTRLIATKLRNSCLHNRYLKKLRQKLEKMENENAMAKIALQAEEELPALEASPATPDEALEPESSETSLKSSSSGPIEELCMQPYICFNCNNNQHCKINQGMLNNYTSRYPMTEEKPVMKFNWRFNEIAYDISNEDPFNRLNKYRPNHLNINRHVYVNEAISDKFGKIFWSIIGNMCNNDVTLNCNNKKCTSDN